MLATCSFSKAPADWLSLNDTRQNDNKDAPSLARLREMLTAVRAKSSTLLQKPTATVYWQSTDSDQEIEAFWKAVDTAASRLESVASTMAVNLDAPCGRCRLMQAFAALRNYARERTKMPDKLVADPNALKSEELAFDKINFRMLNDAYPYIMVWDDLLKRYLTGANAIPAVIDPALLDASVAAFRTAVGKLINAKRAPDSQSPLTIEATYPAACSEFVKAVSK